MDEVTRLATTASVLVSGATGSVNTTVNLQKNKTFASTFIDNNSNNNKGNTNLNGNNGLIGLLAKHGDNLKAVQMLQRSGFDSKGKRKKDFNVLSNEMLHDIPDSDSVSTERSESVNSTDLDIYSHDDTMKPFSLFQGFSAVLPEVDETISNIKKNSGNLLTENDYENESKKGKKGKSIKLVSSNHKYKLDNISTEKIKTCQNRRVLINYKSDINYQLDLLEIRKGLSLSEISEIDKKIDRLYNLRKEITDNVKFYESTTTELENHLPDIEERLEFIKDIDVENDDESDDFNEKNNKNNDKKVEMNKKNKHKNKSNAKENNKTDYIDKSNNEDEDEDYVNVNNDDLNDPDTSYSRIIRSHKHLKPGDNIHTFQAHSEAISCLAFDEPYGRLVTCSTDNTVKLWDMNRYKCHGLLEGHNSYVNCIQVEENLAFTGGMDASVKVWNLDHFDNPIEDHVPLLQSFDGHVDSVTSLTYNNGELISGSDDKTIRQWDLNTGHLIQTIDVMWASSMANSMINFGGRGISTMDKNSNVISNGNNYPFISSLQVFDAALASGSSDGIVRLWDLRSGEVIRQLFGHTGAVTTLQFDKSFNLISGSADRSVRIWDLRTGGSILDSLSYDNTIKKLGFDDMKIVSLVEGEEILRVYDRTEERHWVLEPKIKEEETSNSLITDMSFQGNYLVAGSTTGNIHVCAV